MPDRLGDLEVTDDRFDRLAFAEELLALGQLRITCLGVWRRLFIVVLSSFPTSWGSDSHNGWISSRGPGHRSVPALGFLVLCVLALSIASASGSYFAMERPLLRYKGHYRLVEAPTRREACKCSLTVPVLGGVAGAEVRTDTSTNIRGPQS